MQQLFFLNKYDVQISQRHFPLRLNLLYKSAEDPPNTLSGNKLAWASKSCCKLAKMLQAWLLNSTHFAHVVKKNTHFAGGRHQHGLLHQHGLSPFLF
jgi:hypothetical protein